MSKFFNETQKANQLAQQKLVNPDLEVQQTLEEVKQGPAKAAEVTDIRMDGRRKVKIANGESARLIIEQADSAQAALEAYRGLRTKLMRIQADSGLRSIAISSSIANEGKTLTVMNLGLCYSQLPDQRVLVIDADLRTRGLTRLVGYPETTGLAQVLTGHMAPSEAVLETDQSNFFVLPAGLVSASPPEHFTRPQWQELLAWCSKTFKLVLVDTPPILPIADFELISSGCDAVVMVVRAHYGQREMLQKTARTLDSKRLLGVVFNADDLAVRGYYAKGYGNR